MTTTISTVTFDNDMVWADEYKWNPLNASRQATLGGGAIVQEFTKPSEVGRLITLQTQDGMGYQLKSTVESLLTLAGSPEKIYILTIIHNSLTLQKNVRFRNDVDGGAVQFEMAAVMNGLQTPVFWYSGSLFLEVL